MRKVIEKVRLDDALFKRRQAVNYAYIARLTTDNLLRGHYLEAGLRQDWLLPTDIHKGWESPTSAVRGHFFGHWLSAMAMTAADAEDEEALARARKAVRELKRIQEMNGGKWVFPFAEKVMRWLAEGRKNEVVYVPFYMIHKTLMGLMDMYRYTKDGVALDVLKNAADWLIDWCSDKDDEAMQRILEVETGGMLETLADLYAVTGEARHKALMEEFYRFSLFERLKGGEDALSNMHANTTIPEAVGCARAWEVTGDVHYLEAARAYWRRAVDMRGYYATGGMNSGEIWNPPAVQRERMGEVTQEHCTVYNMIRLADFLYRADGDMKYLDYIERALYNGALAQQHPQSGMPAYFLPIMGGGRKKWGTPTDTFWCCHGSVVQMNALYQRLIAYAQEDGLAIAQYIESSFIFRGADEELHVTIAQDNLAGNDHNTVSHNPGLDHPPMEWRYVIEIEKGVTRYPIRLRMPWWLAGGGYVHVNGQRIAEDMRPSTWVEAELGSGNTRIELSLPMKFEFVRLPDEPDMGAIMLGPVVYAALIDGECTLSVSDVDPAKWLAPFEARNWSSWSELYITRGQLNNLRFAPIYRIVEEPYTIYFRLESKED